MRIEMTFDDWWKTLTTRERARIVKDDVREAWGEATKAGHEACASLEQDAARYRWLREQHWSDSSLCVVVDPEHAVKLGHNCPSHKLLDEAIDTEMGKS